MAMGGQPCLAASAATTSQVARPVLLYSGTCRFCRWAARVIAAFDWSKQLAMLPLGDEKACRLLATVPENRRSESWWIVSRDGMPIAGKSGAGIVLLNEVALTRWLGLVLGALGLSSLIDALDAFLARHRGRLSRFVPDGPAPQRYP